MRQVLVLHGPNLNLTGSREREIYGTASLEDIDERLRSFAADHIAEVRCLQSNHEGVLIDALHEARRWAHGAVLNPGALGHYSYALRDAVAAVDFPVVEVHMSQIAAREPFRQVSVIAPVCRGGVTGLGAYSYILGLDALLHALDEQP